MINRTYDENVVNKIITFFKGKGLNDYAISGILSNWYTESFFRPDNAQNCYSKYYGTDAEYVKAVDAGTWKRPDTLATFDHDAIGMGLAQWTSSGRKAGLIALAKSKGVSIADLDMQLEYAWIELTSPSYKKLMTLLTSATSPEASAVNIMVYYERPSSVKSQSARDARGANAREFYNIYFGKETLMKAKDFVAKLIDIATNYKTLYVLGCFGAPLNEKNKTRYTNNQEYNGKPVPTLVGNVNGQPYYVNQPTAVGRTRAKMIKDASPDTFGFDCVCLIKGILWGWCGDVNKTYGGASYGSNSVPDVGANTMRNRYLKYVSSDFTTIRVGEAVWIDGHIGVYIGKGQVVECTPKWENKVQITNLGNVGNKTGNYRMWTVHGMLPWIDYSDEVLDEYIPSPVTASAVGTRTYIVKKGDTLSKIAAEYNTSVAKIVNDNLKSHKTITANHIVCGWKLLV